MKKTLLFLLPLLLALVACNKLPQFEDEYLSSKPAPKVSDPIGIQSPQPEAVLQKVTLTSGQQSYVEGGNAFALKCLAKLYKESPYSMVFSPLSLQYALAMAANGASGETAGEITRTLGFGADIDSLNTYCNLLLNQLPALDPNVTLLLTDAMLVDQKYSLQPSFKEKLEKDYYAPVEYMSFRDLKTLTNRINEWAHRNTNGLIFPFVNEDDLDGAMAVILNALYFKAPWSGRGLGAPMFRPENTLENETFYKDGGSKSKVDLMQSGGYLGYAEWKEGYRMLEIPYGGHKFAMYILLPDEVGRQGLKKLVSALDKENWKEMMNSLTYTTEVTLKMPKFELANRYDLVSTLKSLGIKKAFTNGDFDRMFASNQTFLIDKVLQKAKIKVSEWGTEAAAVTAITMMLGANLAPVPAKADFFADHPFVYIIAERSSGTILFEGVYTGD